MKKYFDPAYWGRALSNPIVLIGLVVDLLPIYAVLAWGWSATPLVLLYWMENLVAGAMTIPRIVISGGRFGGIGLAAGAGLSVFFVFHYGLFCAVHGTFLMAFISFAEVMKTADVAEPVFMDVPAMVRFGLQSAQHVDWVLYAIIAFQVLVFAWEFMAKGEWKRSTPIAEMFAPYGRIVVLHFGIFAGAAALFLLGQPMVGVLALIVFRAVFGVINNSKGGVLFGEADIDKAASSKAFEAMLKGKDPNAPS